MSDNLKIPELYICLHGDLEQILSSELEAGTCGIHAIAVGEQLPPDVERRIRESKGILNFSRNYPPPFSDLEIGKGVIQQTLSFGGTHCHISVPFWGIVGVRPVSADYIYIVAHTMRQLENYQKEPNSHLYMPKDNEGQKQPHHSPDQGPPPKSALRLVANNTADTPVNVKPTKPTDRPVLRVV